MPISDIRVENEYLRVDTNVDELKKSIETVGLINPVVINQNNELIAGGRRYKALMELGYTEIPVTKVSFTPLKQELISIDENLVRKDLTKIEMEQYLSRGKEIYEQLNPNATKVDDDIDDNIQKDLPDSERSFIDLTAEKTGLSKKSIKSAIRRDENSSHMVKKLRSQGELNASQTNEIIKLKPEDQEQLIDLIVDKSAKEIKNIVSTAKDMGVEAAIEEVQNSSVLPKEYKSIHTLSKRFNKVIAKILLEELACEHEDKDSIFSSLTALRHNIDHLIMLNSMGKSTDEKKEEITFSEETMELTAIQTKNNGAIETTL